MKVFSGVVLLLLMMFGCEKPKPSGDTPAPLPSSAMPATTASDNPTSVVLTVGGEPITFSPVALDLTNDEQSLLVNLSGVDKSAGSAFAFRLRIEADAPVELVGKSWKFIADPNEDPDTTVGIFLNHGAIYLQPKDVQIDFAGKYPMVEVTVRGVFLRDGDEKRAVNVSGNYTVKATGPGDDPAPKPAI